ncbi:HHE domain protein [Microdochium trichocladiopsis]|uniref:HHE domain protein n=1 Tax=Microdochium trichocladiopsis TaxID=1682393 RepID=A0A9P8YK62_9PEZI|nr:HHE domain protein [Microdochium trichocladiopsis]KAH7041528.1 HHE domain protein [Microdochium trichocladiopsis]
MSFATRTTTTLLRPSRLLITSASRTTPITGRLFSSTAVSMVRISEAIKKDHDDLREAHRRILDATTHDEKVRWRNQFTWELARHSIGEELVVYPAFEEHLENGKAMADHDRAEHQTVKEELAKFENLDPEDPKFSSTLDNLWANLDKHMADEEANDMPALDSALGSEAHSDKLVRSFSRTKKFLPTHSHPNAPDQPPFETAVGLLAAPIDHIRDLFRKFPEDAKTGELPP